jgi:hypothetical protein
VHVREQAKNSLANSLMRESSDLRHGSVGSFLPPVGKSAGQDEGALCRSASLFFDDASSHSTRDG